MSDRNQLLAADARLDQMTAEMTDYMREDIQRWSRLVGKIRRLDKRLDVEEMMRILQLADLGARIVTGRALGRKV